MSTITTPNIFTNNTVADATQVNSNFSTIVNDYNGGITNANISSSAAIADSKLAQITTAAKVTLGALTVASQAQGDIIYASSATVWTRLGAGTSGQLLQSGGAAANPSWVASPSVNAFVSTFSRDHTLANGTQAVTGVGFTPKLLLLWMCDNAGNVNRASWGATNSATGARNQSMHTPPNGGTADQFSIDGDCIEYVESSTVRNAAKLSTFDADGFTLTWTKTGSPTTTGLAVYIAIG